MSSRVFTQIDVTETANLPGAVDTNASTTFINTNFGNFGFVGTGTVGPPTTGQESSALVGYNKVGIINFGSGSPQIPATALITQIRVRNPCSVNCEAEVTAGGVNICTVSLSIQAGHTYFTNQSLFIPTPPLIDVSLSPANQAPPHSVSSIDSVLGSDADTVIDLSGAPISLAQLITDYGDIQLVIAMSIAAIGPNPGVANAAQITYNVSASNWELEVTWEETLVWTVHQPSSEPITTGTVITATSPLIVVSPEIAVDFDEVTAVNILIPDLMNPGQFFTFPVVTFTPVSPNLLTIIFPDITAQPPTTICYVELISTQFSGSVEQPLYLPLFVSATGVYQLNVDSTHDTLYIEELPGQTINVKIPNPFGQTGPF